MINSVEDVCHGACKNSWEFLDQVGQRVAVHSGLDLLMGFEEVHDPLGVECAKSCVPCVRSIRPLARWLVPADRGEEVQNHFAGFFSLHTRE